jgi:hypothetical protein
MESSSYLVVPPQKLSQHIAVLEVILEGIDRLGENHVVVQPVVDEPRHGRILYLYRRIDV